MALAIVVENWRPSDLRDALVRLAPGREVRVWPEQTADLAAIDYALVWQPPPGALAGMPNLKAIFSLGAGVDAILCDATIPRHVPLVRVVDPDITARMTAYVVLQVLLHHREQLRLLANQRQRVWHTFATTAPASTRVGILGFGHLGRHAGRALAGLGFAVAGWSRTRKRVPGVESFAGPAELDAFLARTDVLVVLLPHTPETTGILDRSLIRRLSRTGPLGAPVVINAGRGKLQVAADILAALDAGELAGASLDVFEHEPLPPEDPLWSHPGVVISPHQAADSEPEAISRYVLSQIERFERGEGLSHQVDRGRGY
ncbi:MAG: glyoxylate/hydroxypyruvate reductase A [Myxococcales bacterium]|nr:glyoxylate/hydroxypyruvate reductase A [Myxococcales bacterium]